MMTINEYQKEAARTMNDRVPDLTAEDLAMLNYALGLNGEAGEVAEIVKKSVFHGRDYLLGGLDKELGDVLWYVAAICTTAGIDMATVLERNVRKLQARYPNGFTHGVASNE